MNWTARTLNMLMIVVFYLFIRQTETWPIVTAISDFLVSLSILIFTIAFLIDTRTPKDSVE